MKTANSILLASAFLFTTYLAVPTTAIAGGWMCQAQAADPSFVQKQVDCDLDLAIAATHRGPAVLKEVDGLRESVCEEVKTYGAVPDQCMIQDLLETAIADLHARAAVYLAREAEMRVVQFHLVTARFEYAAGQISESWKRGDVADDIAEKALYSLRVEAFGYIESLGVPSIRERLQEAITRLIERGSHALDRAAAQHEFLVNMYTLRLETSLATLRERITDGTATKFDFTLLDRTISALDRLKIFAQPKDCGS